MQDHQSAIVESMLQPGFYPHPATGIRLEQTHISLVFLTGPLVYKIKKPLNLEFLDFTTLDKRVHFCHLEIELNRRLALDIYLDVVPITRHDGRYHLDGPGQTVEYAVKMRQLPAEKAMDHLLAQAGLDASDIDALALVLSRFYRNAATNSHIDEAGSIATVHYNCEENFKQTSEFTNKYIDKRNHQIISAATNSFLNTRTSLFDKRIAGHKIRDCHGDLRTGHIYFCTDGLYIIDCIEFNERFRHSDVTCDLAFLCMDLDFQGYPAQACSLMAAYARHCNDPAVYGLLSFYKCYRAMVRTKINCMRLEQGGLDYQEHTKLLEQTRRYMDLAYRYALEFSRPRIWVVFGMIASGKSTLAQALSENLGIRACNSDTIRKDLFKDHLGKNERFAFGEGIYTEKAKNLTYGKLLLTAQEEIDQGRSVILDASFSRARHRTEVRRLANDMDATVHFIECTCPEQIMNERLRGREKQVTVSDARQEHLAQFISRYQRPDEIPEKDLVRTDTCKPIEQNLIHIFSCTISKPV